MRNCFVLIAAWVCLVISCKKSTSPIIIPPGTYKGTFQRSFTPRLSNVTITFSAGKFTGQSDSGHYPDICNGNYSVYKDSASFQNGCIYTANFDWTYILSGKYKLLVSGDSLFITRYYSGITYFYDNYKLKKQ